MTKNYFLKAQVVAIDEAEISADREEQTTQVRTSVETIRPADIKRIPSFGGAPDLVQALQVLPGLYLRATKVDNCTSVVVHPSKTRSCSTGC